MLGESPCQFESSDYTPGSKKDVLCNVNEYSNQSSQLAGKGYEVSVYVVMIAIMY